MSLKYNSIILLFIFLLVNSIAAIPAPQLNNQVNQQQFKQGGSQSKFVEIKLPGKITSVDDLFSWVKNAMQNMASKIDVKLGGNDTEFKNDKVSVRKMDKNMIKSIEVESKGKTATPRNTFVEYGREPLDPWSKNGNEIYAPLLNVESFLPFFSRDIYPDKLRNDYSKYAYNTDKQASESSEKKTFADTREVIFSMSRAKQSNSDSFESSTENHPEQKTLNGTGGAFGPTPIPFAIPFEAFITITREPSYDSESPAQTKVNITTSNSQSKTSSTTTTEMPIQTVPICNHSKPFFERNQYNPNIPSNYDNYKQKNEKNPFKSDDEDYIPYVDERRKVNSSGKGEKFETPKRNKKKESARKRQIAALGTLLETLGVIRKNPKPPKVQEAATTSSATTRTTPRPRGDTSRRPSFEFGDESPRRPSKNQTSQRQEFDYYDDDDDDDDEQGGSLGSVADLLPLALPILEDLSNPESEADLIEVIQSAIPIIQGLSEVDEDDDGGLNINDLIEMIVPAVIRIINGREGQGIDLGALAGPIFGLLAPFIGPVLAPLIGPLIRTISNPPTEGSSLAALLTAIAGPLSTPQEPSGMSPLSIVIAGAAAALLKELRPGAPGGSDIGALVGSILSGVLAGTSAGLSGSATGGLGGLSGSPNTGGPAPYAAAAPVSSSTFNVGFTGRPSPGPPINSPFINHPTHVATVNIGSTARPPYSSTRPSYSQHQVTVQAPQRLPSPHPQVYHHSGPVSAATTGGNGGSSYLPTGSAVPAASVNPLQLIGTTVQDILGAGIQVVSSLINVVFGIIGGSSASDEPTPSYGAPGPYGQASG